MPALQVREFPEELYEELRTYATKNHRSIAQQTIVCVKNELQRNDTSAFEAFGAQDALDEGAIIPENAHGATGQTHLIHRPLERPRAFRIDSEKAINERRKRRERLFHEIGEFAEKYGDCGLTMEDTIRFIREDRDDNHGRPIFGIDDAFNNSIEVKGVDAQW